MEDNDELSDSDRNEIEGVLIGQSDRVDEAADKVADMAADQIDVAELVTEAEELLKAHPDDRDQEGNLCKSPDFAPDLDRGSSCLETGSWDEIVGRNELQRDQRGPAHKTIDDLLSTAELDQLESFSVLGRDRWMMSDFVTVGCCAAVGVAATVFDAQIDAAAKRTLGGLKNTELLTRWEKDAKKMPIDYMGEGFGGAGHRVRSAGHDIGRPLEALSQIRNGEFRGIVWEGGKQTAKVVTGYEPHSAPEALILWLKHLSADVITTNSLPLPFWSKLYEMPSRDMRKMAHDLYNPADGFGINVRSMFVSKLLPVITTELIVGSKVYLDAYKEDTQFRGLNANEKTKRDEMLIGAHGATVLASTGKVALLAAPGGGSQGPLALRHLNVPAMARFGYLAVKLSLEYNKRAAKRDVPSWDELLRASDPPWALDELASQQPRMVSEFGSIVSTLG